MNTTEGENLPKALLVDDEKEVADAYALRLRGLCDVETVYGGQSVLSFLDDRYLELLAL
jgi:hypothetical protein